MPVLKKEIQEKIKKKREKSILIKKAEDTEQIIFLMRKDNNYTPSALHRTFIRDNNSIINSLL